jgi:hypothetical protein
MSFVQYVLSMMKILALTNIRIRIHNRRKHSYLTQLRDCTLLQMLHQSIPRRTTFAAIICRC